jgi:hypothetical protein
VLALPARGDDTPSADPPGSYLEQLQEEDREVYSDELFQTDPALRDSALDALNSLGFEEYLRATRPPRPLVDFGLEPAWGLMTYNRVEALVAGLRGSFDLRNGASVAVEGAYATASERFRHLETARLPLPAPGRFSDLTVGYADRVVAYGSNRPPGNAVRTFLGSADDQDYLKREGGWVALTARPGPQSSVSLGYAAHAERSVRAHSDFAVFGDSRLMAANAPVTSGIDRLVYAEASWGSLGGSRNALTLRHAVSGGDLGGDFTYTRTEATFSARRYLPARHELTLDLSAVRTGGSPPVQSLADVGGLCTVRGFDRRTRVGDHSLAARAEVLLPYNVLGLTGIGFLRDLRLQFVPWADAARVYDGGSDAWITAAGIGVQRYLGPFGSGAFLRLDAAFPTGPDRPEDARLYLHFSRALF